MKQYTHAPHPIDLHVGVRVRQRRKHLGLSQTYLASSLGLTFQQIQKYERSGNRISASKLYEIAKLLKVTVPYFYEGYAEPGGGNTLAPSKSERAVNGFLATSEGIELAQAFPRISAPNHRRKILNLVTALAEDDSV